MVRLAGIEPVLLSELDPKSSASASSAIAAAVLFNNIYDVLSRYFSYLLSDELIKRNPNVKGLSQINIRYSERFYTLHKDIFPQLVGELTMIPWGHHRIIIDKCKTLEKCLFYIRTTIENNLSRYDLES